MTRWVEVDKGVFVGMWEKSRFASASARVIVRPWVDCFRKADE
jgi:hypothetical protein